MMKRFYILLFVAAMANFVGAANEGSQASNEISQENINQAISEAAQLPRFQRAIAFIKRNKACLIGDECPLALSASLNFALGFSLSLLISKQIDFLLSIGSRVQVSNAVKIAVDTLSGLTGLLLSIKEIDFMLTILAEQSARSSLCFYKRRGCTNQDIRLTYRIAGFFAAASIPFIKIIYQHQLYKKQAETAPSAVAGTIR